MTTSTTDRTDEKQHNAQGQDITGKERERESERARERERERERERTANEFSSHDEVNRQTTIRTLPEREPQRKEETKDEKCASAAVATQATPTARKEEERRSMAAATTQQHQERRKTRSMPPQQPRPKQTPTRAQATTKLRCENQTQMLAQLKHAR